MAIVENFFTIVGADSYHATCGGQLHENSDPRVSETKDCRTLLKKIWDVVSTVFNILKALIIRCIRTIVARNVQFATAISSKEGAYAYPQKVLPGNQSTESKGLYLFIHGLRGSPTDWNNYQKPLEQKDPGAHRFAPKVALKGNCDLETAARPLLAVVQDYLKKFPSRPVTLIGTSNGGRIAAYLETHLAPEVLGSSRLSVVSLAGVHRGVKIISCMKKVGLLFLLRLNKKLVEEFLFGSRHAEDNLISWQQKQAIWKQEGKSVRHLFCATREDEVLRDLEGSLPYHKDADSTYKVVSGHSHMSIVDGVRNDVINWLSGSYIPK